MRPLDAMPADGARIDEAGIGRLVAEDAETARKYDMHDESDLWDQGDDPSADPRP